MRLFIIFQYSLLASQKIVNHIILSIYPIIFKI